MDGYKNVEKAVKLKLIPRISGNRLYNLIADPAAYIDLINYNIIMDQYNYAIKDETNQKFVIKTELEVEPYAKRLILQYNLKNL